jgi:chromosome segregation ATPase
MARHPIIICGLVALALAAALPVHTASGQKIKKCQDAQGRWHYGDTAADACAESKVIEMTGQGIKTKEIAAPPTEAELRQREARKTEIEQEKRDAEEAERRDRLLLSTYGHEDDIGFVRDRKIADLDAQIAASQDTMKSLTAALERMRKQAGEEAAKSIANTEAQIAKHEAHIQSLRQEQESLRVHYQKELERYRQLKSQQAAPPAASP